MNISWPVPENTKGVYLARVNQNYDANTFTHSSTPGVMAPAMETEIPGIANTCRVTEGLSSQLFTIGDKSVYAGGKYAEPSLFNMFTLPFVQGNAKTAFNQLYSVVITEKAAKKFFGSDPDSYRDVIGKTVRGDNKQDYVVTGVLKDIPQNSSLSFEWVAPFEIWYQKNTYAPSWGSFCLNTYIQLKPETNPVTVNKQLYNYIQQREPASIAHVFLFGMNNWHLYDKFENGKQTGGGHYIHILTDCHQGVNRGITKGRSSLTFSKEM